MCTVDQGSKPSKVSKKKQGEKAEAKGEGYKNPVGAAETFAQAVGAIKEQAAVEKGSQSGFLGQPKISIDVKEYSHTLENEKQAEVKPEKCPAAPIWKGKGPNTRKGGKGKDQL